MKPPGSLYSESMNAASLITLRPALMNERELIYHWLTGSDLAPEMVGPPQYPEIPVPSFKEYCLEFGPEFFMGTDTDKEGGRVFMIELLGKPIGQCNYRVVAPGIAHLDIWLAGAEYTGWGYGSAALRLLIDYARAQGAEHCIVRPSARNLRAIRTYTKAGFRPGADAEFLSQLPAPEYGDAVTMVYKR
jgi:RimJ/RimL family protein N-acetyltransferase